MRQRTSSLPRLLVVVVTLLMVFSPLVSQMATAQGSRDDPVLDLPDEAVAEQPEEPVEATEPVVTETVATEPVVATEMPVETTEAAATEPVTEEAVNEPETYTLTISVYRCAHPEFNPSDYQMVIDQCTGPGYGQFLLHSTTEIPASGNQVTLEMTAPLVAVQELIQPGFDDPIADCFLYDQNGVLADRLGPAETSGGYWKVQNHGGNIHCNWYQVDRGIGVVYVVNMACPQSAGLFPAPTMSELVAVCTEPAGSRQFFVQHGTGLSRMGVSGGEFNDVLFDAIKAGPIEIWLDDHSGFDKARVFCQVTTLEGAEIAPFSEVGVGDFRTIDLTLVHGQRLHCSWFNIQEGPGLAQPDGNEPPLSTAVPTAPTGNLSTLTVELSTCPAGYDPTAAGANPDTDCTPGPNGVNFTLTDDDPVTFDLMTMTGDSIPNAVTFGGIAPGDHTVTQVVPGDVAGSFTFGCGSGGGIGEIPHFNSGTEIVGVGPGVLRTCRWFNILVPGATVQPVAPEGSPVPVQSLAPEGSPVSIAALTGTGSLTMYAYACPAGFDVTTVDANPQATCSPVDGMTFDMDDTIDDHGGWAFETGWTGPGYHTVNMLPADQYSISAYGRNGVTSTFAWDCYDLAGTSGRTDPLVMGDFLTYDLADGEQARCDWFFVTGGEGRLIVNSHACGILVPSYTLTYEQLGQQCTDDPGTREFTVVSHTHQETQPASKSPLVLASFAGVPSGYVAVVENNVAGWGTPIVYCQVSLEDGTVVSPPTQANIVVGRQITFELEPGHVVYCDWHNVTAGFVDVHIAKRVCPDGFDAYTADYATLASTCTGDPGTVDFTVEDFGLYLETKPASGADAIFTDVPSGSLRISEKLPDGQGMPVVFCRVDFEDGSSVLPVAGFTVGYGPSVNVNLSGGQVLYCDWYNVVGGIGSVHVWKQACPPGLDVHAMTRQELELQCGDDISTIEFSLTSGTFSASESSTNLFRYADFPAVPAGELTLTETLPTGYGEPIVFCRAQGGPGPVGQDEKMTVEGESSISWMLETGTDLFCRWFNVGYEETTGDNGRVVNYKRYCPEGIDLSAPDLETLEQLCSEIRGGVAFTVENADGFSRTGVTSAQTGVAIIENVPPSEITLRETIPDGYGEPIVFCDSLPKDQRPFMQIPMALVMASGGVIAYEVQPQAEVHCHWFNIVSSGTAVSVIKYACPEGTSPGGDESYYLTTCTIAAGVEFRITHGNGSAMGATDVNGVYSWTDVPLGPVSLQEYIPAGYGEPVVFCGYTYSERPLMDSTGGHVSFDLTQTGSWVCFIYNIPGDPGEITIYKYTCPEGYDPHAWGADPKVDCPEGTNGVPFTVSGPDGYQTQSATGDSIQYAVFFGGLEPGDYTITEQVPDGIGLVFVWDCYGQMMGELRPTPLSAGETLTIAVGADESITCHWYNVPEDPDGKLTVIKYTCATQVYVSEVDCEVYEGGQGFDLAWWNGDSWEIVAEGTTGAAGSYTWNDLDAGEYWLDERDREWCFMSSEQLSGDGNWLNVSDGQETVVKVFNCAGEPGKPGKTPTKYPNTGVPMREEWRLTA